MKKFLVMATIVAILGFGISLMAQEKADPQDNPGPQGRVMSRVKDALKITPEQEAKLKEFHKAQAESQKAFAEKIRGVREEMQKLRQDEKADPNKMNGLIDQMFKLQADQAKGRWAAERERRKIFTPEQLEKMKQGRAMLNRSRMGMRGAFGMGLMQGRMGRTGRMGGRMMMRPGFGPGRGMMMRRPGFQNRPWWF